MQTTSTGPSLSVSLSSHVATLTWSADANGYALETTGNLSGAPASAPSVGIIGQGNLTSSYTLPATPVVQFYRLKK